VSNKQKDRLVAVTGGGHGIGKAIAHYLANAGYKVAIFDYNPLEGQKVAGQLSKSGANVNFFELDVRSKDDIKRKFAEMEEQMGIPFALVNNAGVYPDSSLLEAPEELWDNVLDTNLKGAFLCAQRVARMITVNGLSGVIVNVASTAGVSARVGASHYSASKAGLIMLTKSLALELGAQGIRCNAVVPGLIDVGSKQVSEDYQQSYVRKIPTGRIGSPDEVANVVEFLISDRSSYINGTCIPIDGGFLAGRDIGRSGNV
jgi:3-oxoacyl-[acyl-carrier protein] reductase